MINLIASAFAIAQVIAEHKSEISVQQAKDRAMKFQPPRYKATYRGVVIGWYDTADEAQDAIDEAESGRATYRAAVWTRDDGQAEVRLTGIESADCSDDELYTLGVIEANKVGMDLDGGEIIVTEWREGANS